MPRTFDSSSTHLVFDAWAGILRGQIAGWRFNRVRYLLAYPNGHEHRGVDTCEVKIDYVESDFKACRSSVERS